MATGVWGAVGRRRWIPRRSTALVLVGAAVLLSGCATSGQSGLGGTDGPEPVPSEAAAPAGGLQFAADGDRVHCDGSERRIGEIRNADPNEPIDFTSPLPLKLSGAVADDDGRFWMTWSCQPSESRLTWDITATGRASGRSVDFTVTGTAEDPAAADTLQISVFDEAFVCDGFTRRVGHLSGGDPNEAIVFSSEETAGLRPGTTDGNGELDLNWSCDEASIGTSWTVTATGAESGRSGTFSLVGVAPAPATIEQLAVEVQEDPFVCDGGSRTFAVITNLAPDELVDFEADPPAGALRQGRADGTGELPVRWQCGLEDADRSMQLTATGQTSRRSTVISFSTAAPGPGQAPELAVTVTEDPFRCDGASRAFAVITNFAPEEFVDFTSPQADGLRQGRAVETGSLPIRWQCGAGDIDEIWELTATGRTSDRSITITVTGAAP